MELQFHNTFQRVYPEFINFNFTQSKLGMTWFIHEKFYLPSSLVPGHFHSLLAELSCNSCKCLAAASNVFTKNGGHAFVSFKNLPDLDPQSKPL